MAKGPVVILVLVLSTLLGPAVRATQSEHQHVSPPEAAPLANAGGGSHTIPDLRLVNQNGETVRFSDLIKGKVFAVNSIFTSCATICPLMGVNFARLEKLLGTHMDQDVVLISVSVDPTNDTPAALKTWQAKFHGGKGWTLLTGSKSQVDQLLRALGLPSADKNRHSSTLLVGGPLGWTRMDALDSPVTVAEKINEQIAAQRGGEKQNNPGGAQ